MKKIKTFTHAESADVRHFDSKHRRCAFTLAETLITLMVIGVVAALTIPALMQQIGNYTLEKQRTVFEKKFAEGLRQMRVDGKLEQQYNSTMSFAKEMQKYFKVQALCDSDNIGGCFTPKFNASTSDGTASKDFEAEKMVTAQYLSTNLDDYYNPVGIKLSDGTSMVIVYKKDCIGIAGGDTTGNHTKCIGYIYDVNNAKTPNKLSSDVISNLPLIYPYNLSFELLNNRVYHEGDCETTPDGNEVCYDDFLDSYAFCKAIGGSLPGSDQFEQIRYLLYEDSTLDAFDQAVSGGVIPDMEVAEIKNQELATLLGLQEGKVIETVRGSGGISYFLDRETALKWISGDYENIDRERIVLCSAAKEE